MFHLFTSSRLRATNRVTQGDQDIVEPPPSKHRPLLKGLAADVENQGAVRKRLDNGLTDGWDGH